MLLHLLFDQKFTDYVIEQFSDKEMQSDFVLVSSTRRMVYFHYIDKVQVVNPDVPPEMDELLDKIKNYRSVVFHGYFYPWQAWLLSRWPKNVKIAWVCWGGEIYGQQDIELSFLKPISRLACRWYRIKNKDASSYIFPKKWIEKSDYCLTSIRKEYEYAKDYLGTDIQNLWYSYYSIDETLGKLKACQCSGRNIFLGNSAAIEINHIEAMLQIKKLHLDGRKIIIPLSYGSPWVRNMCINIGKRLFGDKFQPLVDFMPLERYNSTMLDCAVMIQPAVREHAHGNIVTGLWLGMRVYLSEKGIDYKHFKRLGCKVFSIEHDLSRTNKDVLAPLPSDDVEYNRQILLREYGKDHIVEANKEIVRVLS